MKKLEMFALILLIIGGINWGLWGIFEFNFVDFIVFEQMWIARIIYFLVGVSAIYMLFPLKKMCCVKPKKHQ